MENELLERITIEKGKMGGKPCIRGLRFPVADILELLSEGLSSDQIVEQHPVLKPEDIKAAALFASLRLKNSTSLDSA